MADAKYTVELGVQSNKQEFDRINKELDEILKKVANEKLKATDPKQTKELENQLKIIEKMSTAYGKAFDNKTGQINISKLNAEMKNANVTIKQFKSATQAAQQQGAACFNDIAASVLNANIQLKQSNKLLDKMAVTFKNTVRYGISSSIFNSFTNSVQKAYDFTKNLDTSLNDIRIVSGKSADEMSRLAIQANKAAQALGKSTLDYTKAATIYYQQGLSSDEVEKRTEVTLKAANVTGQNAQEVSEQLTAVWNGYQVTGEKLEEYVDKLAAVAAHSASNLEELSTGMSKVASAANVMGVDIDQLNAQMSTIISVTRQAPESVGTALRTIYARMADIKAGLDDEVSLGNYSGKMKKLGFDVLDASGNLKDMGKVIEEIGGKWSDLSREQQVSLAQIMAGTRQYNNLLTLFDNWDKYQDALETSTNAAGTLQKQQDIYMESTEAHLKQLQATAEETYKALFDQEAVKGFFDIVNGGLSTLNKYLNGLNTGALGGVLGQLGTLGANLFSNQIASGITRGLENRRSFKENEAQLAMDQEIYEAGFRAEDSNARNVANAELNVHKQGLDKIKDLVSEDKYKETAEQIKEVYNIRQKLVDIVDQENTFEEQINAAEEERKKIENQIATLKEKGNDLTEEEKKDLDDLNQKSEQYKNTINQIQAEKDAFNENEGSQEYRQQLENQADSLNGSIEKTTELGNEQQRINTIIRGTTALLGTWNNLQAGINIITDENASAWEKFQGLIGVAISQGMLLLTSYSALQKLLPALTVQLGIYTKAEAAEVGIKEKGVLVTLKEIAARIANNIAKKAETVLTKIATATLGAETVAHIVNTAAVNGENVALAILKALLGDVSGLGLLAAAAIGAMVVAIGAGIMAIIDANTGLNYYNKKVEETAEKVSEAKEKYQELADLMANYKDARNGIDQLTEGTLEYYDAILKANEEAQKLIDNLGLIAGKDYAIGKDGLIVIDDETMSAAQFKEQQKIYQASVLNTQARIDRANYRKEKAITNMVNASGEKTGYTYRLTRAGAESVLQNKDASGQIEYDWASKITGGLWEKMVSALTNGHGYADLTDAQGNYQASYNQAVAEINELKKSLADQTIRGYASQKDVATYDSMNSTGKRLVQEYVADEMEKNAKVNYAAGKETVDGITGFIKSIPLIGDIAEGFGNLVSDIGGDSFVGRLWSTINGNIFTQKANMEKDIRADKAKALGYEYESGFLGTGLGAKWVDQYGRDVTDEVNSFDIDQLIEEQRTGALSAEDAANRMAEIYRTSMKASETAGRGADSQKYIANAMMAVAQGKGFNARLLDEEDRKEFLNQLHATDNKFVGEEGAKKGLTERWYEGLIESKEWQFNEAARSAADLQGYNDTLEQQARELDTSKKALELYGGAMRKAGELTGRNTTETANAVAESYKFNKSYNDAVKVYQSNEEAMKAFSKAMKENKKIDYETADAVAAVAEELEKMGLSLSAETISEHTEEINKLLTGTEEEAQKAYEALYELSQIDAFKSALGEDFVNNNMEKIQSLVDMINNVEFKDGKFGQISDDFGTTMQKMLDDADLTFEQIQALGQKIGVEIPVKFDDSKTKNFTMKENDFTSKGQVIYHRYQGTMPDPRPESITGKGKDAKAGTVKVDYEWTETTQDVSEKVFTPDWTNVKVTQNKYSAASNTNFAKAPSNNKKSSSSAQPAKKDLNKEEADRYQLVNVQLKEISKQLNKLDKQKSKLLGGNLVDNLNKQIKLLNDQISVTEAKLKIAQGEQDEVAKKLSGYGITFDRDGNIANYQQIFAQEQAKLNAIYTKYNGMSKEAQDNYKDTVKAAEDSWKTFKESITKYDNLIGETIPTLEQDITTAFDKQTEMFIEEFNAEIKVRLNMSEAEREWNEFKTKVIDGIKDDDVLGLAKSKLKDFNTYYNEEQTGEVQALTKQIQSQLDELRKQDEEGGQGDWYRDNRVKAMEDLKERYDQIRDSLTALVELEEEMKKKILDSMDQAQDKFDAQIDTFETINKQLEHNIELIGLLTDEDNYEQLADQYAAQTQNRKEELDFYTQQKDFWENYLNTLEEGSEEWEAAKEKYNAAAEAWSSALATTIQAARTEFENNIKIIFKTINNQLTNQKGLDYINEEWELISTNSELALDNINKMQGLQDLSKKYNDAINGTSSIKAQQKLAQLRDSELEALKSMDKLSEQDLERAEKKLDIIKAQIALEDAQANKSKMRMRRDSQGNYRYQFVADEDQVNEAQANLYSAYNELYNFDKARYTETLNQASQAWQEYQEKMAEAALINDPEVRAQKEELIKSQYNERIGTLHEQLERTMQELNESTFAELNALYGENEANYELMTEDQRLALNQFENANQTAFDLVFGLYTENTEAFHNMAQDQIDVIQNQMVPQWVSGYQALVDAITGEGGIEEVSNRMMADIQHAIETYDVSLANTEDIAKNTFDRITSGQNDVIKNNEQLLKDNTDLINQYGTMIDNVKALYYGDEENGITGLVQMMNAYKEAADNAKDAAEKAYEYWKKAKEEEAKEYKKNTDAGPTTGGTGQYEHNQQENVIKKETKQYPDIGSWVQLPTGTYFYDAWGNAYKYPSQPGRTVQIKSTSGDLWKVYNSQLDPSTVYIRKSSIGYDTGGYTGEWGNEGRLAMLHQKELVLNKKDTANMLDAVEIMRGITDNIGSDVLSRMASVRAGNLGSAFGGNVLDQNVHIEATFPGVKSSIEIQDALNNLVNMAAQRAQVK